LPHSLNGKVYSVERFVEKPPLQTTQDYVTSGAYYWNAGIFIWRADTILNRTTLNGKCFTPKDNKWKSLSESLVPIRITLRL